MSARKKKKELLLSLFFCAEVVSVFQAVREVRSTSIKKEVGEKKSETSPFFTTDQMTTKSARRDFFFASSLK